MTYSYLCNPQEGVHIVHIMVNIKTKFHSIHIMSTGLDIINVML